MSHENFEHLGLNEQGAARLATNEECQGGTSVMSRRVRRGTSNGIAKLVGSFLRPSWVHCEPRHLLMLLDKRHA